MRTFTIITTEPNEVLQPTHNRMPVILSPQDEAMRLDPETQPKHLVNVLKPYSAEEMEAYEVSKAVNDVRNNTPQCIKPVDSPKSPSLF